MGVSQGNIEEPSSGESLVGQRPDPCGTEAAGTVRIFLGRTWPEQTGGLRNVPRLSERSRKVPTVDGVKDMG